MTSFFSIGNSYFWLHWCTFWINKDSSKIKEAKNIVCLGFCAFYCKSGKSTKSWWRWNQPNSAKDLSLSIFDFFFKKDISFSFQIPMSKYGWCLVTRGLRKRKHPSTSATSTPFSMPPSSSTFLGNKSAIAHWTFKLWILTPLAEMNWLEKFYWHVSLHIFYFPLCMNISTNSLFLF